MELPDQSNGYEGIAPKYIAARGQDAEGIGASVVAAWAKQQPAGAAVLDLGCGTGVPVTKVLIEGGLDVYGIDASARMVGAFRENFPQIPVQCASIEDSDFFERSFDGVVAWGLFFLLSADVQRTLIRKVAAVLTPGARLLFTSPRERCTWLDMMTRRASISLGYDEYFNLLQAEGLSLVETFVDSGENFYYSAQKV